MIKIRDEYTIFFDKKNLRGIKFMNAKKRLNNPIVLFKYG